MADMNFTSTRIAYPDTGFYTRIIIDYLQEANALKPFYKHPVSMDGVRAAIDERKQFPTDRSLLVRELEKQYASLPESNLVKKNIQSLGNENCFTVCTAHQPAIFTGTLYFIYKILHTVKLCENLKKRFPENEFVPVFYMSCEDADLDELGKIYLDGEKIVWDTKQTGAVGRMNTKGLDSIIQRVEGELGVLPFGNELVAILRECYAEGKNIQDATFQLIHRLFAEYGVIVLIPDNGELKRSMLKIFEDDLLNQRPSTLVGDTIASLSEIYKVQANPREINLFYLYENSRARIEQVGDDSWAVLGGNKTFTKDSLLNELKEFPERFSPNVILRGLFQETILPNLAFIGGGGELAYWLELQDLFNHYHVPFPVLVLRNSFLLVEKKWKEKMQKINLPLLSWFNNTDDILRKIVKENSDKQLTLEEELKTASGYYQQLSTLAAAVDTSLVQHVSALETKALRPLRELEKKLLRAEKRKFDAEQRQVTMIKSALFPLNNLQERIDNFLPYYAKWGSNFIDALYQQSLALEQEFVVLEEEV